MELFDWGALPARGALWIGGLSVALAAWSYAFWRSRDLHIPLRQALDERDFLLPFESGLALFAVGLAWGANAPWERLAWLVVAAAFIWQFAMHWRLAHAKPFIKKDKPQ